MKGNTKMNIKSCMLALAALSASAVLAKTSTPEGWTDDYDAALKRAAAEKKLVLADFSGSDWCGWCKRLDREVFATDAFRKGAADKYVCLMVDSPSDKSLLSAQAAKRNPELVKKYGVRGFPTVLLLDAKGEVVLKTGYREGGPEKYLEMLDAEVRFAPDIQKYIKPITAKLEAAGKPLEKAIADMEKEVGAKIKEKKAAADEMERRVFTEILPKYLPDFEKTLKEAKGMEVPARLKARKDEAIAGFEVGIKGMKAALSDFKARKK